MSEMETKTDCELIHELASRHDELIVIRPNASNKASCSEQINIFCKTKTTHDGWYDLDEAVQLLHEGTVGLIHNCISLKEDNE